MINVIPEGTVPVAKNGQAVEYFVISGAMPNAPLNIKVESLDLGRASAVFDDGSTEKLYDPDSNASMTVFVTCKDDKGFDSDPVTIQFTAQSTLDNTSIDYQWRTVICPGTLDSIVVPEPAPNPDPKPNPNPNPNPDPTPNPNPDPTPNPNPNPDPTPNPNPNPNPDPTPNPNPDPTPNPNPDPTPNPNPDPTPNPNPDPTPEPNPDPTPEPNPDPTPEPNPDPTPEPDPTPNPEQLVIITPTTRLFTSEDGTTATFNVVLGQQPKSDVTIPTTSDDTSEGIVMPSSVTFTTSNWNVPQTFTVTGQDDDLIDGDIAYHILLGPTQSSDPTYNAITLPSINVINRDNEHHNATDGIVFSPENLTVYEGGSVQLTTVLDSAPSAPVTLTFTPSDKSRLTIEPSSITMNPSQYSKPKTITISAKRNGLPDDTANVDVQIQIASTDPKFKELKSSTYPILVVDTEGGSGETVSFRAMAANISTGNYQSYDPGHGIRIFKAVKPDIVMIQEFRYGRNNDDDINSMVSSTFGPDYFYSRGRYVDNSWIPNGIISRYPIIESGYWKSNLANNRDWEWAILDLPGKKELLVVSLHLLTKDNAKEIGPLTREIENKIADDKKKNLDYYVMVGGDFNSSTVLNGKTDLKRVVYTSFSNKGSRPKDQDGDTTTNATRGKTLDVLLVDDDLQQKEIPAKIGRHSYNNGHVFDSRVYDKLGELGDVPPVQADDCKGGKPIYNQHMAVIRDFEFTAQ